jgi:hypothetical protein
MPVPSLHEFDKGKEADQGSHGGATKMAEVPQLPHRFLYTLDLPRIHRLLRPVKAKIAAIHHAINTAPSFGYAPIANPSKTAISPTAGGGDSEFGSSTITRLTRGAIKRQYGQSRSLRSRPNVPSIRSGHKRATAFSPTNQPNGGDSNVSSSLNARHGSDALVKRFRLPFRDLFKEVVEKVWWHPLCEGYGLSLDVNPESTEANVATPGLATLGMSCAFAVGRVVARLSKDDSDLVGRYYSVMPPYMRRYVGRR